MVCKHISKRQSFQISKKTLKRLLIKICLIKTIEAHHHVPFSIWGDEAMTICWMWSERSKKCDWNGGEYIANEATMIRCDPSPGFKLLTDTGESATFD